MSQYRRACPPGGCYFFTVITYRRQPWLVGPDSRRIFREAIRQVRRQYPFGIDAWVLLPDHLHCIWTLPECDTGYAKRWGMIKAGFTRDGRTLFECAKWISPSKTKHRESTLWQRRFWEHQVRDPCDF